VDEIRQVYVRMCEQAIYGSKVDEEQDRTTMVELMHKYLESADGIVIKLPHSPVYAKHLEKLSAVKGFEQKDLCCSETVKLKQSLLNQNDFAKLMLAIEENG
jgi:hypothetical protein